MRRCNRPKCDQEGTIPFGFLHFCPSDHEKVIENRKILVAAHQKRAKELKNRLEMPK